jgi:hypothetical protein
MGSLGLSRLPRKLRPLRKMVLSEGDHERKLIHVPWQGHKTSHFKIKCSTCKKSFWKICARVNVKNYCSQKCQHESQKHQIKVRCWKCHRRFLIKPFRFKHSKNKVYFCSRICKSESQRIVGGCKKVFPPHYKNGCFSYRDHAFRVYKKKCEICGYKKYKKILEVHHIDRDRQNSSAKNLIILCPNHHRMITNKVAILVDRKLKIL